MSPKRRRAGSFGNVQPTDTTLCVDFNSTIHIYSAIIRMKILTGEQTRVLVMVVVWGVGMGGGGHTHQPVRWFYWINFSSFTITNYDTQTAVVWSCLPFIRSCQNHLARHNERGKKTRQTGEEVGWQHQGMDRPGVRQVPEGSGKQGKMGKKLVAKSSVVPQRPSRLRDR